MSKRKEIIELARKQLGIRNGDKYRNWYNKTVGYIGGGAWAWCVAGVLWLFAMCGLFDLVTGTANATELLRWFRNKGQFKKRGTYTPKSGDVVFFKWSWDPVGDASHVGIVEYVEGNTLHTIEFNSGDSDDGEVARWTYDLGNSAIVGYGVPAYPDSDRKVKLRDKGAIYENAYKDILGGSSKCLRTVQGGATVTLIDGSDDGYGWSKVRYGSTEGWMMNSHLNADDLSTFPTEQLRADTHAVRIRSKKAVGEEVLKKGTVVVVICEIEQGRYSGKRYVGVGGKRYYI
jgi:hypothetical protein